MLLGCLSFVKISISQSLSSVGVPVALLPNNNTWASGKTSPTFDFMRNNMLDVLGTTTKITKFGFGGLGMVYIFFLNISQISWKIALKYWFIVYYDLGRFLSYIYGTDLNILIPYSSTTVKSIVFKRVLIEYFSAFIHWKSSLSILSLIIK